jgi:hypothetical protein
LSYSAHINRVHQKEIFMRRALTWGAVAIMALGLSAAPAGAATIKSNKINGACAKVGAKAKVGKISVTCATNAAGKKVWTTADCLAARKDFLRQNKTFQEIYTILAESRKKLQEAAAAGATADVIQQGTIQLNGLEGTVKLLEPSLKQVKKLSDKLCSIK